MLAMGMEEERFYRLSVPERSRKIVGLKMREWVGALDDLKDNKNKPPQPTLPIFQQQEMPADEL